MTERVWYCVRQRAGPLVKECRALRPRFGPEDDPYTITRKNAIRRAERTAVTRSQADRLECMLALMGRDGVHYTLTFDDFHLPSRFDGVRRAIRAFFGRAGRYHGGIFDWIYAIEGLHGDHRYHVHMVLRGNEFPVERLRKLWKYGQIDDEPVLRPVGGFRRLAVYFNKERADGLWIPIGRHPWSCSRSLREQLPPPEKWKDTSGYIGIPNEVSWSDRGSTENDFGCFCYGSYILQ